uniref:Uncharacterized protein n=1 Tax=viral metagenome TaxID=1070528 RepID=A0A6M3KSW6_9ZZZZ
MSRNSYGRYKPAKWTYPTPQEWMTPQEHRALKSEFWVMMFLLVVGLLAVFAEPLMDVLEMLVTR